MEAQEVSGSAELDIEGGRKRLDEVQAVRTDLVEGPVTNLELRGRDGLLGLARLVELSGVVGGRPRCRELGIRASQSAEAGIGLYDDRIGATATSHSVRTANLATTETVEAKQVDSVVDDDRSPSHGGINALLPEPTEGGVVPVVGPGEAIVGGHRAFSNGDLAAVGGIRTGALPKIVVDEVFVGRR